MPLRVGSHGDWLLEAIRSGSAAKPILGGLQASATPDADLKSRIVKVQTTLVAGPRNQPNYLNLISYGLDAKCVIFVRRALGRHRVATSLTYRFFALNTGENILEIEVRGKRGVGYCKSMAGAVRPFERLLNRDRPRQIDPDKPDQNGREKPKPTDRVFPANHKKQFNRILDLKGLKFDREGNRRAAYSLRHTYICMRLMEGADIYQIAKNCRTSVEMIGKYYASHIKDRLDAAAINVRKPKKGSEKRSGIKGAQ